jgi:hypothetical protein
MLTLTRGLFACWYWSFKVLWKMVVWGYRWAQNSRAYICNISYQSHLISVSCSSNTATHPSVQIPHLLKTIPIHAFLCWLAEKRIWWCAHPPASVVSAQTGRLADTLNFLNNQLWNRQLIAIIYSHAISRRPWRALKILPLVSALYSGPIWFNMVSWNETNV